MPLPTVALTVEKMFPANCIPSPESPEKRTTTWSNSFTSKFSAIELVSYVFIEDDFFIRGAKILKFSESKYKKANKFRKKFVFYAKIG